VVDGFWLALEFEDDADGSFVEVEVQAAKPEGRTEFFISETRAEAENAETAHERLGIAQAKFAFGTLFVARPFAIRPLPVWRRCRRLDSEDGAAPARCLAVRGGGCFNSHSDQPAGTAEIGIGRIEQRVSFKDATVRDGSNAFQAFEDVWQIGDPQLYFDLGRSLGDLAHTLV